MGKNTPVSLGNHFDQFNQNEVSSGRYGSASDVIRTAHWLLENEEAKLNAMRSALLTGEQSGWVEEFNPQEQLKALHNSHK